MVGAGLLFQYMLSAIGFVVGMVLRAMLTGSPLEVVACIVLVVFGVICFVPLVWFFVRGAKVAGAGLAAAHGSAARTAEGRTRGGMSWMRATQAARRSTVGK